MKKLNLCILTLCAGLLFSSCQQENFEQNELASISTESQEEPHVCTFDLQNDNLDDNDDLTRATIFKNKKWPNGSTIRVKFLNGDSFLQNKVKLFASQWSKYANIKFAFVGSNAQADIKVAFKWKGDSGSWSYLGTDSKWIAQDQPSMNFGWFNSRTTTDTEFSRVIVHEFGHALGLHHEHQHPTNNIQWNKPVLYKYYANLGWTKEQVDRNVIAKISKTETNYSSYDRYSIMHYSIPKEHTTNGYSVGWNTVLSNTDKSFIAGQYKK